MLPAFVLADQYGATHTITLGAGRPVVLVFADHASTGEVRPWVERLTAAHGDAVTLVGVAALGVVPTFLEGVVRGLLQPLLAGQPSVLLDWGNVVSNAFGYDGGGCLLVVVDGSGVQRGWVRGALDSRRLAAVEAALAG